MQNRRPRERKDHEEPDPKRVDRARKKSRRPKPQSDNPHPGRTGPYDDPNRRPA